MEWSIQEIARRAGTTSRTLRYYGDIGLLAPSRTGANGYRYYDQAALVRLQRILLLRELGLSLSAVKDVLEGQRDTSAALRAHLGLLERERERIGRQIASVRTTLHRTEKGQELMAEDMFDGFDHTVYEEEVTERWGPEAYERGDRWWRGLGPEERTAFLAEHDTLARDYGQARAAGLEAGGDVVQDIARRHCAWLSTTAPATRSYVLGLGAMYVADPRFAKNYDRYGDGTAALVRDALTIYARHRLSD
ncbi:MULTISPECIES: MerR family transcriptional regulator [unclassified Streptomyces]|uniref:MerR family transcriptional regulator n=1 Tax=unclassified Streptomyces TaxID=2593676 RepID=UPI00081B16EB|nr:MULTISPECIES: MerR family transcriptional regulator [unclassified Streptomyces]MYQ55459.1 MerR family transcriptional regulator [Streptomyces sp. SID4941]SCE38231.1 DNA-binding transcriptional regulator, MerR family [Streptomyces sp. PalvLS-984]SDE28365.1 DNA-binding transcriptional regulator, MerR family [Streptomyces sp. AmelKG-A3]